MTPFEQSAQLQVQCDVVSDGNKYQTTIMFLDVEFDEDNQPSNITFTGSDNDEYHMVPINLSTVHVKVSCECLDFYWRFAHYNSTDNSLHGNPPPPHQKTSNRKPVNPQKVPGVCKHLIKAVDELNQSGIITRSNV